MQDQKLWTWHLAAGLVILVLLGLHMAIMHLDAALGIFNPSGGHPIDWANVVARGQTLFFSVTYVLLLGVALFHGLYGLRNILLELAPGPGLKTAISWLLIIAGVALFVLGTWAAWAAHQVAQGGVLVQQPVVEVPRVALRAPWAQMPGARLRHSGVYVAGSATPQMGPSRRNPEGARGLRPHAALGLVTDVPASHSSARLACERRSLARDPRDFYHGLLKEDLS